MTKPRMVLINIPFPGFYESNYSYAIDHEEESFIEYHTEENGESTDDYEEYWPEELRLDGSEYSDILIRHTEYQAAYHALARQYVSAFDFIAGEAIGHTVKVARKRYDLETKGFLPYISDVASIRMQFESMTSPREYNFETDRLFAEIPVSMARKLFNISKTDKHVRLAAVIADRFTSYDGFYSHYSNRLADWLAKALRDWDHNELGTLLIAAMQASGESEEEVSDRLYQGTCGDEGAYQEWSAAVDWPKFEAARAELRAEKLAEWIEEDAEAVATWWNDHRGDYAAIGGLADAATITAFENNAALPYRCESTPDLFA